MSAIRKSKDHPHMPKIIDTTGGPAPEAPLNAGATGLERPVLLDLLLKYAHSVPQFTTDKAVEHIHLTRTIVNDLLEQLRTESFLEVLGREEAFGYRYTISARGRERASRMLEISGYVGPAPVTLDAYRAMLEWQIANGPQTTPERVREAIGSLVLPEEIMQVAGLAISSGRSLFLYGPPGNGKTSLGRQLHTALSGSLWIPYAIASENNIIRLYDPHCHHAVEHATEKHQSVDRRWVKIERPFIVAGGEMTLASLDLAWLPAARYYEAPLHMKANGGTFLIDDFGRQRVAPEELLNRWIVPLENQIDFMTLHTGQKIEVPFLLMLIIATNLDPKDVTDPAFLRRIGYRVRVSEPSPELYADIFRRYAAGVGMTAPPEIVTGVLERYRTTSREMRACEPRDLIERVRDICHYKDAPLEITPEFLNMAWEGYFGRDNQQ